MTTALITPAHPAHQSAPGAPCTSGTMARIAHHTGTRDMMARNRPGMVSWPAFAARAMRQLTVTALVTGIFAASAISVERTAEPAERSRQMSASAQQTDGKTAHRPRASTSDASLSPRR